MRIWLVLCVLAACKGGPSPAGGPAPEPGARPTVEVPMSDPAEYAIERISRDAGQAIFERTGLGDPYRTGIPYPIFLALLRASPQTFGATPGELAGRFGFVAREADPASKDLDVREGLPVGMHLTTDPITGVPFVVTACALCHAERLRWPGGEALVIGLGNKRVRIHDYDAAFSTITKQPSFSAQRLGRLADEAAADRQLTWPAQYREPFVGATLAALKQRAADRAELHAITARNPPGRVATIETFALVLGQLTGEHVDHAPTVGWAKVPDVIGYAQRTTLSWDGSGEGPIDLLVVEADVAAGVRVAWLERHPFQGASLGAYLRQPAKRPAFPGKLDRGLAERGRALFGQHCASCHGTYAPDGRVLDYDETIVAIEDLGVDPARMMAATESFERAANDPVLTRGYTRFRRSSGYVPPVLTNVWARAPFGHVGQWPSLAVLATAPAKRPTRFVTDAGGVYDLAAVGMPWQLAPAPGFVHDASQPGFSVLGHPFLADLGRDAPAVIEYLKTL
jgi:mono/diheme cytochrome c family protein